MKDGGRHVESHEEEDQKEYENEGYDEEDFDSVWYCFAVAATVGFGDITAVTIPRRIISIILCIYSVGVVAVFTAVITGFFREVMRNNADRSVEKFMDDLEHLPDLSEEELKDLSLRIQKFRKSR